MAWDLFFKRIKTERVENGTVETEVAVAQRERKIDVLVSSEAPPARFPGMEALPALAFPRTIIEFKSSRDSLAELDLTKLVGYYGFYCKKHDLPLPRAHEEVNTLFVSANRPRFLDTYLAAGHIEPTDQPGLYSLHLVRFSCHLLVVAESPPTPNNWLLSLLGPKPTLRAAFHALVTQPLKSPDDQKYIWEAFLLNYKDVKNMADVEEFMTMDFANNIKAAMEHFGIRRVIRAVGIKDVVEAVGIKDVVEAVGIKDVVEAVGIKDVVEAVGIKDVVEAVGVEQIIKIFGPEVIEEALKKQPPMKPGA